ncbi:MAG: alpha-amylase family glycosyl hydrolase [Bacteroidia bacterium]|nr:alpha-amylase family glycosyl hydrolase [Bacteroidia bacterium]
MKFRIFCLLFFCVLNNAIAQTVQFYPPNWYVGMEDTTFQLIIKQKDIGLSLKGITSANESLKVISYEQTNHPDYVLVECVVPKLAKAGKVALVVNGKKRLPYELLTKGAKPEPLTGNDLVYVIMPDRFANGDATNDVVKGMREQTCNRAEMYARHGGDLVGIKQKLGYIDSLGATAIWLTPFQENNEHAASYHGYAITNHYKVDPRFGTNNEYVELSKAAKASGFKWVLDLVFNHIGDGHWLYLDKPFPNAVHAFDSFTRTNYRANTLMDPYAAKRDQKLFTEGWFDKHMPDLNCDDPIVARYLIQNTLWWIENSQADGIRIDTYSYPEQEFMQQWYQAVRKEYPKLAVFGEIWEHAVPLQSYFVPKQKSTQENMQHLLDFQFCFAIDDAVNQKDGWTEGISKLYYTLTQDYQYSDPYGHIIFMDNHDLDRFYSIIQYDLQKWKAAVGLMLTTRGIPSILYGTEILMRNKGEHGLIREDFIGGWPTDTLNKFVANGRTAEENEAWNYLSLLANWRKSNPALSGKLTHFIPENGVYVYFRINGIHKVMVVYNSNADSKEIQLSRFAELLNGHSTLQNVVTQNTLSIKPTLVVPKGELLIFEVK